MWNEFVECGKLLSHKEQKEVFMFIIFQERTKLTIR
jgi:hypothetical protein